MPSPGIFLFYFPYGGVVKVNFFEIYVEQAFQPVTVCHYSSDFNDRLESLSYIIFEGPDTSSSLLHSYIFRHLMVKLSQLRQYYTRPASCPENT